MKRSTDPIRETIQDVRNLLDELFQEGYQYRSLNPYHSAISSVHEEVDREVVGQHSLISWLLKRAFNESSPRIQYHSIWDVHLVLNMFRKNGLSEDLTNQNSCVICSDSSMQGCWPGSFRSYRSFCPECVTLPFVTAVTIFTFRHKFFSSHQRPWVLTVCPGATLEAYELKTKDFLQDKGENHLFRLLVNTRQCSSVL